MSSCKTLLDVDVDADPLFELNDGLNAEIDADSEAELRDGSGVKAETTVDSIDETCMGISTGTDTAQLMKVAASSTREMTIVERKDKIVPLR